MQRCRLRTFDGAIPGNYPYHQRKGIDRKFPAQPMIEAQGSIVSAFRQANGLERSSLKETIEDISLYTCMRLGCMSQFCVPVDSKNEPILAVAPNNPIVAGRCRGCGAVLT